MAPQLLRGTFCHQPVPPSKTAIRLQRTGSATLRIARLHSSSRPLQRVTLLRLGGSRAQLCNKCAEKRDSPELTERATALFSKEKDWGGRRGLNPRHSVPQTDALPAELLPPLRLSLSRLHRSRKMPSFRPAAPAGPRSLHCSLRTRPLHPTFLRLSPC